MIDWLNENQGAVEGLAAIAAAAFTVALIYVAWRSLRKTGEAIKVGMRANEVAEHATKAAHEANQITARGFFGASVVVFRIDGRFVIRNLGAGPARNLLLDFWVDEKPIGSDPVKVAFLAQRRNESGEADFHLGSAMRELQIAAPSGWTYVPGDTADASTHEAMVHVRYEDQFGEQETFSGSFSIRRQ